MSAMFGGQGSSVVPAEAGKGWTPRAAGLSRSHPATDSGGACAMTVHHALVPPAIFAPRMLAGDAGLMLSIR